MRVVANYFGSSSIKRTSYRAHKMELPHFYGGARTVRGELLESTAVRDKYCTLRVQTGRDEGTDLFEHSSRVVRHARVVSYVLKFDTHGMY